MKIISRFYGGCSDGERPYVKHRKSDEPTPWAFVFSDRREKRTLGQQPQASIYRLREITVDGDVTVWHYDFDHFATSNDALRWMADHVDPDPENW